MRIPFVRAALVALVALTACRTGPLAGRPLAPAAPSDLAVGPDLAPPVDLARCPPRFRDDPTPNAVRCGEGSIEPLCMLGPNVAGCYRSGSARCGGEGTGGPAIKCDGPEDCAVGERCHLFIGEAIGQDEVMCVAAGAGSWGGAFCHSDDDCGDGACYEDTNDSVYFGGTVGVCRERCD